MKCAIVDERISPACERSLLIDGFTVIKAPPSRKLSTPVSSHPDMLMFYHGGDIISSAEYCEGASFVFSDIREYCDSVSFTFTSDVFSEKYPYDAIFNALVIKDKIFIKTDTVSQAILEYAGKENLKIVPVKQGYPACTTLAFGSSAITSDRGMKEALTSEGIEVTLIENGAISLPPYEYGFIGGCAGVYKNTVYFLGNIELHPDSEKIKTAIENAGYTVRSLSSEPLADLGRIIFID